MPTRTKKPRTRNLLTEANKPVLSQAIDEIASSSAILTSQISVAMQCMPLTEGELDNPERVASVKVPDEVARFYSVLYDTAKQVKDASENGTKFIKQLGSAQWAQDKLSVQFKETERRSPAYKDLTFENAEERWKLLDYIAGMPGGELSEDEATWHKAYTSKSGGFDKDAYAADIKEDAEAKVSISLKITPK